MFDFEEDLSFLIMAQDLTKLAAISLFTGIGGLEVGASPWRPKL